MRNRVLALETGRFADRTAARGQGRGALASKSRRRGIPLRATPGGRGSAHPGERLGLTLGERRRRLAAVAPGTDRVVRFHRGAKGGIPGGAEAIGGPPLGQRDQAAVEQPRDRIEGNSALPKMRVVDARWGERPARPALGDASATVPP